MAADDGNVFYNRLVDSSGNQVSGITTGQDENGNALSNYSIATNPSSGSVSINSSTGAWTYTIASGYSGTTNFEIGADDDNGNSDTYEVSLTISQSGSGSNSGVSIGDPYVWPIKSNVPVKLPNGKAVYRMFEHGENYVNALVDEATDEHQMRMKECFSQFENVITDGYFYTHLFIHAEGHEMILDFVNKKDTYATEESLAFFKTEMSNEVVRTKQFNEVCRKFNISWKTTEGKNITIGACFFDNPHIENGITATVSVLDEAIGMLVDNYKPKLMKVPQLTTASYDKIWRRLHKARKPKHFVNIKPKNETWVYKRSNNTYSFN